MYVIKNNNINLCVTMNHRMWVSHIDPKYPAIMHPYEFKTPLEIMNQPVRYKMNANWSRDYYQFVLPAIIINENIIFDEKSMNTGSWLIFYGLWIIKGTLDINIDYQIVFKNCNTRILDCLRDVFRLLGYNYCSTWHNPPTIYERQLSEYLKLFDIDYSQRFLASWVWQLNQNNAEH
jgi:hypothetical protein